ncbi:F-box/kelch-repeat protein [Trifolium repens]|nr:F-box/kelch-repeat protein [Trifolium repens]
MDETITVKRLSGGNSIYTSSPSSTYTPLEIIQETILCRLPVKSLQRFRCVCKPWDSLISKDLKFAKKHLRVSPKRQHLLTATWRKDEELTEELTEELKLTVMSYPFDSLNLHSIFDSKSTQLDYSLIMSIYQRPIASCDGILCFGINQRQVVLYNPCIRKLQKLPCLQRVEGNSTHYTFGYDPFIDNYKVVAVFNSYETQVEVHSYTLGTDSWKRIKDFPSMFSFNGILNGILHGIFMRGTVNWLTYSESTNSDAIVSLHLGKESYQQISLPFNCFGLYVMRECLCVFEISQEEWSDTFIDVWLMKEYGNKESWIKLFHLPCFSSYADFADIVYISEDNHMLHVFRNHRKFKWAIYDFKNDTFTVKSSQTEDNLSIVIDSQVYVESLMSPS